MILNLLSSLLLSVLWGFLLVGIFWSPALGRIGLRAFLAGGVGLGISSCTYFLWLLAFDPSGYFQGEIVALLGFAAIFFLIKKARNQGIQYNLPSVSFDSGGLERALALFFCCSIACAAGAFIVIVLRDPHGGWDAWAIWNLHARFLFRGGEEWKVAFLRIPEWSHPDYPLLLPASVARSWHYAGADTLLGPALISLLFTAATIGLLASAISGLRGRSQGYLAGLVLIGTRMFVQQGASQYADIPLSFYFLATFVLLSYQQRMQGALGPSFLAGIAAGFSAWTKNEGLLFVGVVFIAWLTIATFYQKLKGHARPILSFFAGLMPVIIIIFYSKAKLAPSNDLVSSLGWQTFERIMDLSRYILTTLSFFKAINSFKILYVLAVYFLFLGITDKREEKFAILLASFAIALMIFGYFFIYIITPHDLNWHLSTSLNRLLVQLWPSIVFAFFLFVRSPEEAGQRVVLLGSGLVGLAEIRRKFRK